MAANHPQVVVAPTRTISDDNQMAHYALQHSSPLPEILRQVLEKLKCGIAISPILHSRGTTVMAILQIKNQNMAWQYPGFSRGVFCGASAVAAALALPADGRVIGIDTTDAHFEKTKRLLSTSNKHLLDKIDLRIVSQNAGNVVLDQLIAAGEAGTFDFAFIDADKQNDAIYYEKCLELLRPGGVIVIDNALWDGAVLDLAAAEADQQNPRNAGGRPRAVDECNKKVASDERVLSSLLNIADGMNFIVKRHDK